MEIAIIVVGEPYDDAKGPISGSAHVFQKANGNWDLASKLTASDGSISDSFGMSVAVLGNRIVVGSSYFGTWCSAYVFECSTDGSICEEKDILTASNAQFGDGFGWSVSLSGDVIVVGAPWSSQAYIFEWNASTDTWRETANLSYPYSSFGSSVGIHEDFVIVGAKDRGRSQGAAYIFTKNDTSAAWEEQVVIGFPDDGSVLQFGWSVEISQDRTIVGSPFSHDFSGSNPIIGSGPIHVYEKN